MIAIKQLTRYPIPPVMDVTLEKAFERAMEIEFKKKNLQPLSLLRTFLDVSDSTFHYLQLNKSQTTLIRHIYGFVYAECDMNYKMVYTHLNPLTRIIKRVFIEYGSEKPLFPYFSKSKITDDIKTCVEEYHQLEINSERLNYYEGWTIVCKGGEQKFLNLSLFYSVYGEKTTLRLLEVANTYFVKRHLKTVERELVAFKSILSAIVILCPTLERLNLSGSTAYVDEFIIQLFMTQKLRVKANKLSIKGFYVGSWPQQLVMIEEMLIKSGIWSQCSFRLFRPQFKSSSTHANTHKRDDELGNTFNNKLITHIPLSYTDDDVIRALLENIENDIEFVSSVFRREADATMQKLVNRKMLATKGDVKYLKLQSGKMIQASNKDSSIDMTIPTNKCANWEYYKWDYPGTSIKSFLGIDTGKFAHEFGLLTAHVLTPFLYLLVKEHPQITSTWLTSFELYNKNGKRKGIIQSGETWKASSFKRRKGNRLAQQIIPLNSISIRLFENIIELTSDARAWLKSQGNDDWRFLFLSCGIGLAKPVRKNTFHSFRSPLVLRSPIGQELLNSSSCAKGTNAKIISNNLNLSSFRASCGVLVYLKTRSVKAMSDALGHDKYNPKLLSSYLPDPILRFFQGRWVRIFQNALVYESMKDSDKLFEAMDITEENLEEFLRNHGLKPLPEHITTGQVSDLIESREITENLVSTDAIIPVSEPLLRVINAVVELVESAPKKQLFTPFTAQWYETSKFLRDSIAIKQCSEEVINAMAEAELTPLARDKIKEAIYAT